MRLRQIRKTRIAFHLLKKALNTYFDEKDYISALHLAGASEEILGKSLEVKCIDNALKTETNNFRAVYQHLYQKPVTEKYARDFLNRTKNAVKHMNVKEEIVIMDPKEDAEALIERAITNWYRLGLNPSQLMEKFLNRNLAK